MSCVHLVCGKLCSGKSYYARLLKQEHNAVILSTDEVTWDLTGNEQGEGYDRFASLVNLYLRKKAAEIVRAGANVILDWGFWTKEGREDISLYFRQLDIPCVWHYVEIDDLSWERNIAERNSRVAAGNGGSDFYVDEGLKQKVLSLFQPPERDEIDVWHCVSRFD